MPVRFKQDSNYVPGLNRARFPITGTGAIRNVGIDRIVDSGLVLHLDAGNTTSYSGSGTIWTDLSGYGNNGTLVNGPSYSSSNGGIITLDGINDYITLGGTGVSAASITISMWIKFPTLVDGAYFYVNSDLTGGDPELRATVDTASSKIKYYMYDAGAYFANSVGSNVISTNTWYNLTMTITNLSFNSYLNLSSDLSTSGGSYNGNSTSNATYHTLGTQYALGSYGYGGYSNIIYGKIAVYNRVLTNNEISQNYGAMKYRYGLP